ncbi:MAG: hypothetical protein ACPL3C_07805 [Pyrobaculum sp.]
MRNVRRIRGFSLLSTQHRVQYIQTAEPYSIEYKTDASSVSAVYKITTHRIYVGAVSASDRYTAQILTLHDPYDRPFMLDVSQLAPIPGPLSTVTGKVFRLDVSVLG